MFYSLFFIQMIILQNVRELRIVPMPRINHQGILSSMRYDFVVEITQAPSKTIPKIHRPTTYKEHSHDTLWCFNRSMLSNSVKCCSASDPICIWILVPKASQIDLPSSESVWYTILMRYDQGIGNQSGGTHKRKTL